jgi:hypothetical protein
MAGQLRGQIKRNALSIPDGLTMPARGRKDMTGHAEGLTEIYKLVVYNEAETTTKTVVGEDK